MDEYNINFLVNDIQYTAKFIIDQGVPVQFYVFDIKPEESDIVVPITFQFYNSIGWKYYHNSAKERSYMSPIIKAIIEKCQSIGFNFSSKGLD